MHLGEPGHVSRSRRFDPTQGAIGQDRLANAKQRQDRHVFKQNVLGAVCVSFLQCSVKRRVPIASNIARVTTTSLVSWFSKAHCSFAP